MMLIEFNVENFLSFKNLTTISMASVKSYKQHKKSHIIKLNNNSFDLLKTAVIYGNNASGKSNLLKAMGFMKTVILNSFRDALVEEETEKKIPLEKFALDRESAKETSLFEVSFIHNNIKYRYGFEMNPDKIIAEWLFHTTSKEVYLFKRDQQDFQINKTSFKEAVGREKDVKENVLFLSLLATLGKELSSEVVEWFKKFNFINGIHDRGHKRYTIKKLKTDKQFLKWVLRFLKTLEITNLSTTEEDVNEIDLERLKKKEKDEEIINLITSIHKIQSKQPKRDQLITYHRQYDKNNVLVDTVAFNFDKQESEGTKKLLYLLGPWYDTLQNGKVLIVDELDSRLHTKLIAKLIDLFHQYNTKSSQLIFAVHDVSLLKKEIFRRDQIWFIEKDQFGSSDLFSLADFKTSDVRGTSAFNKNYIEGKYGAIPHIDIDNELKDLLYGEAEEV